MSNRLLIGAHLSTSAGLAALCHTAVEIGATCAQLFTTSPQQWRGKTYNQTDVEAFHAAQAETGVAPIVSHESYLINLASSDPALLEKSRLAFDDELQRCGQLGLPAVVLHWGSYKGGTLDDGLDRLAESLNRCLPLADDLGVQLLLETTAGQGAYLGGEFGQYPRLFDRMPNHEKIGACLDLCHVFVAGYDMREPAGYAAVWDDFDRTVGISRLRAIHVNDTEKALGSHGDRHANLGTGNLGHSLFRLLMHDPRLVDVPKILETPNGLDALAADLQTLRDAAV
jgi:deoxyribonuclease-4